MHEGTYGSIPQFLSAETTTFTSVSWVIKPYHGDRKKGENGAFALGESGCGSTRAAGPPPTTRLARLVSGQQKVSIVAMTAVN